MLGGLRDPRLFALGGAAVWAAVWIERPPLGPAAAWLPWLGWACLSALVSPQPWAGLPVLARWSAVLAFASLAAAWTHAERRAWLRAVLAAAVVLGAAAVVTGARRGFGSEMTGLLPPHYNYTAFVLACAGAAAAAWGLHPAAMGGRRAALAGAVLAAVLLILARSRGGLLGLGAAAVVWSMRKWGARALAGLLAAAAVAAVLVLGVGPLRTALTKGARPRGEARPAIWSSAASMASESPWFGEGPGNFLVGFRRRPVEAPNAPARWGLTTPYAHSEPLQAAGETGWVGAVLWLWGFLSVLACLPGGAAAQPEREAAVAAVAAGVPLLLVDNMLQIPALAMLWLSAAACGGLRPAPRRPWPRAAAAAGAFLALAAWIPGALARANPSRAAALFPADSGPREDLAWRAEVRGDAALAERLWSEAERLAPFDAIYPWRRAVLAARAGRWSEAESRAGRAIDLEPRFLRARALRALALAREGRRAEAGVEAGTVRAFLGVGPTLAGDGYEGTVHGFDGPSRRLLIEAEELARAR
ncbi:MAG TPA: hypothetical protein DCZ01_12165 [Elusimicrobia bacterium]|nr:MAG: hypothetical protein A2X37_02330 [Elusimicrobia bacterium GWA2_66_18]HAZ09245.1 hypothetical protein [Elusimicrobiota bacterium]